ncbi:hypothetical protein GWK48_06555 [Metallosphaera tengchongensis]|uniref:DUF308 domain-containing protein n=1 Tax=Metallosphaera tengchongensis TaxID=1532350 RepID=A0A6N0NWS4_9CREN|nr:hypothetical protein [Metallosphaera tengchongensis]QKR00079.1 hypothetical protein GWK48_06555 [Metallosphaera tengchongensis]
MPRRPKLNITIYDGIRRGSLSLVLFATFLGISIDAEGSILYYIPLVISYLSLFLFGWLNRRSFSSMGEEYNLTVRLFMVLIAGLVLSLASSVLVEENFSVYLFSITELIGSILVLSYIFEYSFEMVRLGNQFNSRGLKIASGILLISTVLYFILGVIPFAIAVTAAGMLIYVELTKIVSIYKK